jgi:hypothetical protein
MRIHNLYADSDGESHFRDIEVEWLDGRRDSKISRGLPVTELIFRQLPPDYDLGWHPAPRRQYIIYLDTGVEITASDGESRLIAPGEVLLVEDTTGRGHISRAVDGKLRHCIFVATD